jgi:hypothetical protein
MLARFDHHPMLTALLALTTAVLVVVVITLATLLITSAPPAATSSTSNGNPAIHARSADGPGGSSIVQEDPIDRHAIVVERLGGGRLH